MHGLLPTPAKAASEVTDQSSDQTVSRWFPAIVSQLLPKDAGLALHLTTGFEERSCYRYAAGDRKIPGDFLRALLRSEQGFTWLAAVMDGAEPDWWCELQAARDLCIKYKIEMR